MRFQHWAVPMLAAAALLSWQPGASAQRGRERVRSQLTPTQTPTETATAEETTAPAQEPTATLEGAAARLQGRRDALAERRAALAKREALRERLMQLALAPKALDELPLPSLDVSAYVANEEAAIALGKALFWDQQMASDGLVSCASCHYHFGVDVRTRNTVAPGGFASAQSPDFDDDSFFGPNRILRPQRFPFHAKRDPLKRTIDFPDNEDLPGENEDPNDHADNILRNIDDVVGSAGIVMQNFEGLIESGDSYEAQERGSNTDVHESVLFRDGDVQYRSVTGRNSPTPYGAVYHARMFWDGRGENTFNGVNPFGKTDPTAMVWKAGAYGENPTQVRVEIANAALASQAVGPVLSAIETSYIGRSFPEVGQKLLTMQPLAQQEVHPEDSVLGGGVLAGKVYADLVREAFRPEWYAAASVETPNGPHTQMEANFSLFWGISIMLYERTLIPDNTKYDEFAKSGFQEGFTDQEVEGLRIFLNEGKCISCHDGPLFAGALVSDYEVEAMQMQFGDEVKNYDSGFYNIGVTPTVEDLGLGGVGFNNTPLSETRRTGASNPAVDGSFKSNTLRNIAYTGPYMHNGSMKSLREVVEFYARGGNFANEADRSPDVNGIKSMREDPTKVDAMIAFLHTLTDRDALIEAAPFDHPSLTIANGARLRNGRDILVTLPATGRTGLPNGQKLREFQEILADGGLTSSNRTTTEE